MLDKFNVVAGLVLDEALEAFPLPAVLDAHGIVRTLPDEWRTPAESRGRVMGDIHIDDANYVEETRKWLLDEGFLRDSVSTHSARRHILSAKGITALNAAPEWLGGKESLGQRLRRGVATKSWELVKATVPAMIGVLIK